MGPRAEERRSSGSGSCTFDGNSAFDIPTLLQRVDDLGISIGDLQTHQSSLEDIFVSLVSDRSPVSACSRPAEAASEPARSAFQPPLRGLGHLHFEVVRAP